MYGITDSDPFDVMDRVRLIPVLLGFQEFCLDDATRIYPLNARLRAVYNRICNVAQSRGSPIDFKVVDIKGSILPLNEPLVSVLARTNNVLYLKHEPSTFPASALSSEMEELSFDAELEVDSNLVFDRLHPSVLDGVPLDLYREVGERFAKYFPHLKFELFDMQGKELSERHTNRYYITGTSSEPYFMLVPKVYSKKVIEIDLASDMTLSLESKYYSFDAQDKLVLSPDVFDSLGQFIKPGETITKDMLNPVIQLLPGTSQAKARTLKGQQLVDFLTAEFGVLQERLDKISRIFTSPPPGQISFAEYLANNINANFGGAGGASATFIHPDVARQLNLSRSARFSRAVFAGARIIMRKLNIVRVIIMKLCLWLYQKNIASVLLYVTLATALSYIMQRWSSIIYLLWVYAFLAVMILAVDMRANINIMVLFVQTAYPQVYPIGETPADILPAVPEASVRKAVERASREEAIDYDGIVESMVIKPSWLRVAAICIGSLDPVSYKEWMRQVRKRRSLAYDAVRLAVTKQQQIGV